MTKPHTIQFEAARKDAEVVGKLVCQRAKRQSLEGTRINGLHGAGDKLLKASRRGAAAKVIKIWTFSRHEAECLFMWIAWCHWPSMAAEFTDRERNALVSIANSLIECLGDKKRMSLDDARYVIDLYNDRKTLPDRLKERVPDYSQVFRLRSWVERVEHIFSTELNEQTPFIQSLIAKKYRR